jgi:small subunit ribosomal protein S6
MKRYETIVIIDPDLTDEQRPALLDRLRELIFGNGGLLVQNDEWGLKKLAYEIKKKPRGYYTRLDYCGTGILVQEMERVMQIDDRILKYMTVLVEEEVDMDRIQEEIERAQATLEEKTEPMVEEKTASGEPSVSEAPETSGNEPESIEAEGDREEHV